MRFGDLALQMAEGIWAVVVVTIAAPTTRRGLGLQKFSVVTDDALLS